MNRTVVLLCLLLASLSSVTGQTPDADRPNDDLVVSAGIGLGGFVSTVKPGPAQLQGVGRTGGGISLILSSTLNYDPIPLYPVLNLEGGFTLLPDHGQFTQATTGGDMSSSVSMMFGSVSAGVALPVKLSFADFAVGANYGVESISGKRSIENCVDCHEDKIELKGGSFLEPTIQVIIDSYVNIGFFYRFYGADSGLDKDFLLKVSFLFPVSGGE